jgi:hypothetical protein
LICVFGKGDPTLAGCAASSGPEFEVTPLASEAPYMLTISVLFPRTRAIFVLSSGGTAAPPDEMEARREVAAVEMRAFQSASGASKSSRA